MTFDYSNKEAAEKKRQRFYKIRRERKAELRKAQKLYDCVYPKNRRLTAMAQIEKNIKDGKYKDFYKTYENPKWRKKANTSYMDEEGRWHSIVNGKDYILKGWKESVEDAYESQQRMYKLNEEENHARAIGSKFANYRKYLCALETNKEFNDAMLIIQDKYQNPFITNVDLAHKYGRPVQKVNNLLQDNPIVKMDEQERAENILVKAYDAILSDIAEITRKNVKMYRDEENRLKTTELKDLSSIAKDTLERKNLMEGKATENQNITINFN